MLKKELEAILFKVRVMLSAHGCTEGFWMGNLKHKNVAGERRAHSSNPRSASPTSV